MLNDETKEELKENLRRFYKALSHSASDVVFTAEEREARLSALFEFESERIVKIMTNILDFYKKEWGEHAKPAKGAANGRAR